MIDCTLIVVSYRSAEDVAGLLTTVPAAAQGLSWRALVVNNEPTEDLGAAIAHHHGAEVVDAAANLGYAGGINLGMASAPPSRWTVFLNPDLRLRPGALAEMADAAGEDHAAVPRIVDETGAVQASLRREPTVLGSLGDALFGAKWLTRPGWLSEMVHTPSAYETPGTVAWATGAALMVPTAIAHGVGTWDAERFFLYSEETDYCRRLRQRGTDVRFTPRAVVSHRGGGSGASDALYALLEVNRVRYFRKWHGPGASAAFAATAVLNNLLRSHRPRSRAALSALLSSKVRSQLPGGGRPVRPSAPH